MKYALLTLIIISFLSCSSQKKINAAKNKQGNLIGFANKASFPIKPYNTWFTKNFDSYSVDSTTIKELKEKLKGIEIKGFMGTWCEDSKREIPRFYKILEQADFNFKNLQLVTVNRSKKTPSNLQKGYNIVRIPTFIFYKNDKEIGRYVEYARESLEKDILTIVSEKPYKHVYDN